MKMKMKERGGVAAEREREKKKMDVKRGRKGVYITSIYIHRTYTKNNIESEKKSKTPKK